MASLFKNDQDLWVIQYYGSDKKKQRIYLGKIPDRTAQRILPRVEELIASRKAGMPISMESREWLMQLSDTPLAEKLISAGLIEKQHSLELGAFLKEYQSLRSDIKPSSKRHMLTEINRILEYFTPAKKITQVTLGDAERFRIHLLEKYSPATVGRALRSVIQFFDFALRSKMISENPFKSLKVPKQVNEEKMFFVTGEVTQRVLKALRSSQKRIVFALARYGGLRIPSEILRLKWSDINWQTGRILVYSPKTEHHEGKDKRYVPLFPELKEVLEKEFKERDPDKELVCPDIARFGINLRTEVLRAIRRAGIEPWPKLFVNLRSSRETELVDNYPLHVVTRWIGHTPDVAKMHYLQMLDRHWESASTSRTVYQTAPTEILKEALD